MLGNIEGGRMGQQNEIVRWHNRCSGDEFEYAAGVGGGHGSLVCCSPWGHKELDRTEQLD